MGKVRYIRKELTKKEKENLLQMNHLLEREIAKCPEWRGLVEHSLSFEYTRFKTRSADYYNEKSDKISLNHHLASTYILSAMNPDFSDNRIPSNYKMTVDIYILLFGNQIQVKVFYNLNLKLLVIIVFQSV